MRTSLIVRAVTTSWVAVTANAAVGFLLTPYVLHHLGDEAYGLWILTVNCVGYYGLLDVGIRSSILRYVSKHQELHDSDRVNEVVATAFYYYLFAAVVIILATFLSVNWVARFFGIHGQVLPAFKSLYMLAGTVQGLMLPMVVFAGSLEAAGRFDQMYLTTVLGLGIRVAAIIAVIRAGGGLFAVGAATLLSQLLVYCVQVPLSFRANRGLSLHVRWVRKNVFRNMLRYGSVSTAVGLGERLRGYIYPLLIARFLSPASVTLFALPVKLMAFPTDGVGTMTEILNPLSSRLEAKSDFARLRRLILNASQTAFLLLVPLAGFLIVFGREILSLWVGPQYTAAYGILVLVTLGLGAAATQCCMQSMLFGIERHKTLMWYRLGEGLTVLIVGSAALKFWGLIGYASVIAGTLLFTSLVLVPRYLCKILDLPLRKYLTEGVIKACIVAAPTIAFYALIRRMISIETWMELLGAALAGGALYFLTLFAVTLIGSRRQGSTCRLSILQLISEKVAPVFVSRLRPTPSSAPSAD